MRTHNSTSACTDTQTKSTFKWLLIPLMKKKIHLQNWLQILTKGSRELFQNLIYIYINI